jgi:hypothetical protein
MTGFPFIDVEGSSHNIKDLRRILELFFFHYIMKSLLSIQLQWQHENFLKRDVIINHANLYKYRKRQADIQRVILPKSATA